MSEPYQLDLLFHTLEGKGKNITNKYRTTAQYSHFHVISTTHLERYVAFQMVFYVFIFRERESEGEREEEKHHCVVASRAPPAGDLAYNPGMFPDWESNL